MHAILNGAWRFALVSVLAFGFWALESKFLPRGTAEIWTFAGCLGFFILFTEIFMVKLVHEPNARAKFHRSFVPAFIIYAVVWSAFWFGLHSRLGEWMGSAVGCAAFATILGRQLGARTGFCIAILFLIVTHAAGYFLGGKVFYMARHPPEFFVSWSKENLWAFAKLMWGLFYGLGFGAGIGYAFHVFQHPNVSATESRNT
ncbi:MAG TPA: hypothetical protein VM680_19200 [Verrucomicrobiae bacterium]|nr:hypothetical protein [Verrucomicrobiae bacterium]